MCNTCKWRNHMISNHRAIIGLRNTRLPLGLPTINLISRDRGGMGMHWSQSLHHLTKGTCSGHFPASFERGEYIHKTRYQGLCYLHRTPCIWLAREQWARGFITLGAFWGWMHNQLHQISCSMGNIIRGKVFIPAALGLMKSLTHIYGPYQKPSLILHNLTSLYIINKPPRHPQNRDRPTN